MLGREVQQEADTKRCARCPESARYVIWGVDVCPDCSADWNADPTIDALTKPTLAMPFKDACQVWAAATRKWARETKQEAA